MTFSNHFNHFNLSIFILMVLTGQNPLLADVRPCRRQSPSILGLILPKKKAFCLSYRSDPDHT
jgi:hypothetical protein